MVPGYDERDWRFIRVYAIRPIGNKLGIGLGTYWGVRVSSQLLTGSRARDKHHLNHVMLKSAPY